MLPRHQTGPPGRDVGRADPGVERVRWPTPRFIAKTTSRCCKPWCSSSWRARAGWSRCHRKTAAGRCWCTNVADLEDFANADEPELEAIRPDLDLRRYELTPSIRERIRANVDLNIGLVPRSPLVPDDQLADALVDALATGHGFVGRGWSASPPTPGPSPSYSLVGWMRWSRRWRNRRMAGRRSRSHWTLRHLGH